MRAMGDAPTHCWTAEIEMLLERGLVGPNMTPGHWKMRLVYERELEFRKRCAEMGLR